MGRRLLAFDSGIGGLSVVACLRALLPGAAIDYLADNALFPYGGLADAVLTERVCALVGAAIDRLRPDVAVIACNTASTVALDALRARHALPFVGCVPPIKWAAAVSRTRHIGLLATAATVRRPYLAALQRRYAPDCTLVAHGAPDLAGLAEAAFRGHAVDEQAIRRELHGLFGQENGALVDVVGIGCTHYSVLLGRLRALSPPGIAWLDPAAAVARRAAAMLGEPGPEVGSTGAGGAGDAWFTKPPEDADALLEALKGFGYGRMRAFAA